MQFPMVPSMANGSLMLLLVINFVFPSREEKEDTLTNLRPTLRQIGEVR